MKVLHINTADSFGGAAKAAFRLHQALLKQEVNSQMFVQQKNSDHYSIIKADVDKADKFYKILRQIIDDFKLKPYKNRTKTLFSPASVSFSKVVEKINDLNPDIVHLHWICGSFISIEDLRKINKPIVWSLHDNWVFTGGCHIKWDCEKYLDKCGKCPVLGSNHENDLSRKVFDRKQNVFSKLPNLKIIGLSRWISNCARESALLKNHEILNLPNVLSTELYKPIEKKITRELLSLPLDKKLIMFGAINSTNDINKGFDLLLDALSNIESDAELVVFGSSGPQKKVNYNQRIYYLGHLYDDYTLNLVYNAADVMIVPSLQENLSNAIMEAMSCGTPVVAFDVGGNADLITHKVTGYLAIPKNASDLAKGIDYVLNNTHYDEMSKLAREYVIQNFDDKKRVIDYINLYDNLLENS